MISSIHWVPAGVSAPIPKKYELSTAERELIELMEQHGNIDDTTTMAGATTTTNGNSKDKKNQNKKKKGTMKISTEGRADTSHLPDDLRMDDYSSDEDEEEQNIAVGELLLEGESSLMPVVEDNDAIIPDSENNKQDKDDKKNAMDDDDNDDSSDEYDSDDDLADVPDTREYVPIDVEGLKAMGLSQVGMSGGGGGGGYMGDDYDGAGAGAEGDDYSDIEDVKIMLDDAVVVVAKTEDDFASLEVNVYDSKTGGIYVHHDIPLPSFPLCLAHGQVCGASTGNFCAVGTFSPGIEIWNLDVLNALEPSCTLGGEDTSTADDLMKLKAMKEGHHHDHGSSKKHSRKNNNNNNGLRTGSHTDAVMSLSWNPIHKQVIASGSADCTVKLWDITKADTASESCNAATFKHHRGKVQSVAWHPNEGTLLATGSYDRAVALLDARSNGENVKKVKICADCEAIAWDPFTTENLTVVSEDGTVSCWDVRKFDTNSPLWSFVPNEFGGITDLSYNEHVPGMLAMSSVDKTVSLWDARGQQTDCRPQACGSKDMCSGKLYTVSFYPSDFWLLGCAGSGNQLALWDLSSEEAIQKRFSGRLEEAQGATVDAAETKKPSEDEFDAMMATKESSTENADDEDKKNSNKKKKGKTKGKRKVRKAR